MEVEHIDVINMDASPGYPWVSSRPRGEKGKKYLFNIDGSYTNSAPRYVAKPELKDAVKYRMKEACYGRRVQTHIVTGDRKSTRLNSSH